MNLSTIKRRLMGDRAFYAMVLAVAVPMVLQDGITTFVGLLDNVMVGRTGTELTSGDSGGCGTSRADYDADCR